MVTQTQTQGSDKPETTPKKLKGFAYLKKHNYSLLLDIASTGGRTAHELGRAHVFTSEEAQQAGRKGGAKSKRRPK